MFGFQFGESADAVAHKRVTCRTPSNVGGFLSNFDLSTIKNDVQLSSMGKNCSGISEGQAKSDVQAWMRGKQF